MYVYLYLYDCKMYIHGYRAACLACMCTCESCESCLSLSRARALSLALSLSKGFVLWCFSLHFQERTCKRWALSHDATSVYNNLCVRMQHIKSIKYEPQHKTRARALPLSLSLSDALLYTSASAREASQRHAVRVETINTYRL